MLSVDEGGPCERLCLLERPEKGADLMELELVVSYPTWVLETQLRSPEE